MLLALSSRENYIPIIFRKMLALNPSYRNSPIQNVRGEVGPYILSSFRSIDSQRKHLDLILIRGIVAGFFFESPR